MAVLAVAASLVFGAAAWGQVPASSEVPAAVAVAAAPAATETPTEAAAPKPPAARQAKKPSLFTSPVGAAAEATLKADKTQTAQVIRTAVILTLLGLLPAIAICMTPFVRFVVVLSMVRHAFGMPETPPNPVLISLALFLTAFVMAPTLSTVNSQALQPFLKDTIPMEEAFTKAADPMKTFMLRQVHDQDLRTVYAIAKRPLPPSASQVGLMELTTAFMLNELRVSFRIGFMVMLPFLLIDLVVSSILLALGMMMVPPATLSLPLKVLMFVLIDGWSLVLQGVASSFR